VSSKRIVKDLGRCGVVPNKTLLGVKLWSGPEHLMRHYYRGIMDGDGWLSRSVRATGYVSWDVGLCGGEEVVKGFSSWINREIGSSGCVRKQGKIWKVSFGGTKKPQRVAKFLYDNAHVYLDRKKELANKLICEKWIPCIVKRNPHVDAVWLSRMRNKWGSWNNISNNTGVTTYALKKLYEYYRSEAV
jgi:hypothetical protein